MLLLDPAFPPLWRSPETLQFGADGDAVLHDPPPWQQRLLHELARGLPENALGPVAVAFGGTADGACRLVERLRPVLHGASTPASATVGVRRAAGCGEEAAQAVLDGLRAAGLTVVDARTAGIVVLAAAHVVAPVDIAALMCEDRTHLPVVFTGSGVTVGPVVHPGVTACLMCVHQARTDADQAWPAIASQLLGCAPPTVPAGVDAEAGFAAARLLAADDPAAPRRSLTLRADRATRLWHRHDPHPDCGCRSLGGTATGAAPTTATACVVPA